MKKYRGFQGEVSLGSWAPSASYTSTIKPTPVYSAPVYSAPSGYYPTRQTQPISPPQATSIPYYDPTLLYTRSEIVEMIAAQKAAQAEITSAQNNQGGDGIAEELERIANEENATNEAIATGANGSGVRIKTGAEKQAFVPIAILGALAYFLL